MKKVNDSNRTILEKTFAHSQTTKIVSRFLEKEAPISEEDKKNSKKQGKFSKENLIMKYLPSMQ